MHFPPTYRPQVPSPTHNKKTKLVTGSMFTWEKIIPVGKEASQGEKFAIGEGVNIRPHFL